MSNVSTQVTRQSVTVSRDGEQPLTMFSSHKSFDAVKGAIRAKDWDMVFDLMDPAEHIVSTGGGRVSVLNGEVFVRDDDGIDFRVPTDLGDTLQLYLEENLPLEPVVNFALKLNKNPSYRSVQQLFGFIKANNITITEDGNFIAYKGVREDFKDSYSGTFDNSVGQTVKMSRNQVNENPEETCSNGLHVAAYDYAHTQYGFGACGVTLVVEVSPEHVVAVPNDYNNAKMRVCEYKVLSVCEGQITSPLYRSPVEDTEDEVDCCDDEDECTCPCCCSDDDEITYDDAAEAVGDYDDGDSEGPGYSYEEFDCNCTMCRIDRYMSRGY